MEAEPTGPGDARQRLTCDVRVCYELCYGVAADPALNSQWFSRSLILLANHS
jgi:hypothetical protein